MINKRLFGSDISSKVKKKLEVRQHLAQQPREPNEEITTKYPDPALGNNPHTYSEFVNSHFPEEYIADLSSRTPIARMWTSLQLERYTDRRRWSKHSDGDYKREPFGDILKCIPLCDDIIPSVSSLSVLRAISILRVLSSILTLMSSLAPGAATAIS